MVVAMGRFQIFTRKMDVSPNIHPKNGCSRYMYIYILFTCQFDNLMRCMSRSSDPQVDSYHEVKILDSQDAYQKYRVQSY